MGLANMTVERSDGSGFVASHDAPVSYMQRTREYYAALGYTVPYAWAHYRDVPFHPLRQPLAHSRIAIVTTAAPYRPGKGNQGPGAPYNAAAKFFSVCSGYVSEKYDLRISHVAIDRKHTTAEDPGAYFPLPALLRTAECGRIGSVASRFHCLPTNRSQRTTLEIDCPELISRCRADAIDAAILVPNCPICHQSVSLTARELEANGVSTVTVGCAKDIVEYAGVPRFLFSDFPLGNSAGKPRDEGSQNFTLELALRILESAPAARTTVQSPLIWSENPDWKLDYCNVTRMSAEELERKREEFNRQKEVAKQPRQAR